MTTNFQPFERGIIITGKPSFDSLQTEFSKHRATARSLPFILGDLLAYGELTYDAVDQMLEGEDYCDCPVLNRGTAYNYKSVSLAWWPPERKVYPVAWSWYQATMSLPVEWQDKIMLRAIEDDWNRDRLRAEVGSLQQKLGIARQRQQVTYPSDREFDLMVENSELKEEISRMREDSAPATLAALDSLAGPIRGWFSQQQTYSRVIIYRDGRIEARP